MRILLETHPFPVDHKALPWENRGRWPCSWVGLRSETQEPHVSAYRLKFTADHAETVRVHISADERYELYLDGQKIGRGSERGDPNHWYFETYDLEFSAGAHTLVARVSALADLAPFAQTSVRPGLLICPQDAAWQAKIGTGHAPWEAKVLGGYQFDDSLVSGGTGYKMSLFGEKFPWGFEHGLGEGWQPVEVNLPGMTQASNDQAAAHYLSPATLPEQIERPWEKGVIRHISAAPTPHTASTPVRAVDDLPAQHEPWTRLIKDGAKLTLPPNTRLRVILDLENYLCAYPEVVTSQGKGGYVRVHWVEALYNNVNTGDKGNRDEIEGKFFSIVGRLEDGVGDCFYPDGAPNRKFETLWWECGRYVEIVAEAANEPLTIESIRFLESRYPLEMESQFETNDSRFQETTPIMLRTLQMCSHETYMDCPYYEQLQYIGDTRLQVLTTYAVTHDDRLPRKALRMFDASRMNSGLTQSRYPARVRQIIPPFSLWYVTMLHDYLMWRDDIAFVRELMPGIRNVLDAYRTYIDSEGLLTAAEGWNFSDWVPHWRGGVPPDGADGISALINYHAALAYLLAADLETALGEPEMAQRHRRTSEQMSHAAQHHFWDDKRGLLADDLSHQHWSEHTQCLALLVGNLSGHQRSQIAQNLVADPNLERTTIYFSHYLFEALHALNRPDQIQKRLEMWFGLKAQGFKTTLEHPEPSRSDCHAWGAHPIYHYFASFLGIRPTSPGFKTLEIRPQFGSLEWIRGQLPHPKGHIEVSLHQEQAGLVGSITLPEGVTGVLKHAGRTVKLQGGQQNI